MTPYNFHYYNSIKITNLHAVKMKIYFNSCLMVFGKILESQSLIQTLMGSNQILILSNNYMRILRGSNQIQIQRGSNQIQVQRGSQCQILTQS